LQDRQFLRDSRLGRHKAYDLLVASLGNLGQERSAHHGRAPHDSTTTDKSLEGAEQCLAGMLEELHHLAAWPQLSDRVLKVVQELVKAVGKKLTAPSGGGAEEAARSLHKSIQLLLEHAASAGACSFCWSMQLLPSLVSLRLHKPAVEALHKSGLAALWCECECSTPAQHPPMGAHALICSAPKHSLSAEGCL
jgi:hypothetical protein